MFNFARGQTPADDVCVLKCILKHRILRKIRATFLSLSEEKKGDVSWSKAITSLTWPSSVFPDIPNEGHNIMLSENRQVFEINIFTLNM